MKVPLVAVKVSNAEVSISVGPVTAFSVGGTGGIAIITWVEGKLGTGIGCSDAPVGQGTSVSIKVIGCTGSRSTKGGVLDPDDSMPVARVASASCCAACNSAIREDEFVT